ncbi:MAG: CheR family methyltransferase [Maricaulaceae bacterium]
MTEHDFDYVRALVRERSGLVLTQDKSYLIDSRLSPVARREGFATLSELIAVVRNRRDERLARAITDAMTTNETFFFRDKTPFELMKTDVMPILARARATAGRVRIWCAAASTGQEPYSLAMLLDQMAPQLGGVQVDIVATDISDRALAKAKSGLYTQFEVQRGLPVQLMVKYFEKQGELWAIKDSIKHRVEYKLFNLLDSPAALGRFDIVFCRNVLIYFDQETKSMVLNRMAQLLPQDGFLFLGAAETVMGLTTAFQPAQGRRGLYQRTQDDKARAVA